ncbi:23S rRNA (uracil-5-)-methyltransferase RumA, partial [Candidatus Woesearchaeota archaeon]|nr:23S rRNA (uracil-5-)-methyltransferase RumA [Candidatus Woesearchaeota archaeon]
MVDPLCPYFGTCGGCTSQHIAYEDQVLQKRKALESATGTQEVRVITGNPYHYRNRMDFVFHPRGLGLRRKGEWWSIVDIERCVISNANLNTLLAEVRSSFNEVEAFDVKKKRGLYRYAVIRT